MSIHDLARKIKGIGEGSLASIRTRSKTLAFLGVLVGTAGISFGTGYAARAESHTEPLVAIECPLEAYMDARAYAAGAAASSAISAASAAPAGSSSKSYVASKNGTKYYPAACSGANRIKEENRVYFDTKEAAERAGYGASSTCK